MMFRQKAAHAANSSPIATSNSIPLDTVSGPQSFSQKEISDLERVLPKSPVRKSSFPRDNELSYLDLESMLAPNSPIRGSLASRPAIPIDLETDYNSSEIDSLLSNAAKYALKSKKSKDNLQAVLP